MRASVPNPFLIAAGHEVAYRDAVRCGDFVFVSGQVAMDYESFGALHTGDVVGQSVAALGQMEAILGHFDLSLDHVVKLHAYLPRPELPEARRSLDRQAEILGPHAACAANTVSRLVRDDLLVELDAIAVADAADRQVSARRSHDGLFPAAVSAGPLVYISGHTARPAPADTAAELELVLAAVGETLAEFGIGVDRLVKLTVQATEPSVAAAVEALLPGLVPNAAVTSLVVPRLFDDPGATIALDGVAALDGLITPLQGASSCTATPLVFLSGHRPQDTAGTGLLTQTAEVMEAIDATMGRCGASMDALVKHRLFYAAFDEWTESVEVRARYVSEPLAALGVGAECSTPDVLIQSDAVAFIDGRNP
jgi:enamine deaminase RidA (YjgF/YER057c/UK114 family)